MPGYVWRGRRPDLRGGLAEQGLQPVPLGIVPPREGQPAARRDHAPALRGGAFRVGEVPEPEAAHQRVEGPFGKETSGIFRLSNPDRSDLSTAMWSARLFTARAASMPRRMQSRWWKKSSKVGCTTSSWNQPGEREVVVLMRAFSRCEAGQSSDDTARFGSRPTTDRFRSASPLTGHADCRLAGPRAVVMRPPDGAGTPSWEPEGTGALPIPTGQRDHAGVRGPSPTPARYASP